MSRRNFSDGQELVIADFNALSSALERGLYDRVVYELTSRAENAFFGDSFLVNFASANSFTVKKGLGFMTDATQVSPEATKRPLTLAADANEVIASPDGSNDRIDLVCVKATLVDELSGSRKVKDAISNVISNQTLVIQKDWEAEILQVQGTAAPTPSAPATPAGYVAIAEIYVTAVSGIANSAAITDMRSVMPIGALTALNTLGYSRLTAGASTSLATLMAEIDAFLKRGRFEYFDIEEMDTAEGDSEPGSPGANHRRIFWRDGVWYEKDSGGTKTPIGSGGGGAGGGAWRAPEGSGAIEAEEASEKVFLFPPGGDATTVLFVKVPQGYLSGRQITMFLGQYSPAASGTMKLTATTYLVRKNIDAVDSTTNAHVSTNAALTNTVANQYREASLDLTSALGTVNGFTVTAGDLLRVELARGADTDTQDVRLIPSSTEVKFG